MKYIMTAKFNLTLSTRLQISIVLWLRTVALYSAEFSCRGPITTGKKKLAPECVIAHGPPRGSKLAAFKFSENIHGWHNKSLTLYPIELGGPSPTPKRRNWRQTQRTRSGTFESPWKFSEPPIRCDRPNHCRGCRITRDNRLSICEGKVLRYSYRKRVLYNYGFERWGP